LRYFEVAPGGFSSHEKHVHSHIVIGARGHGTLLLGGRQEVLQVNDVAYIAPLQEHQLRNDGPEPFGFFCIVDHDRDRPMSV
jgi:ribulose-bisphosphate carboxylase large chain